MRLFLDTNIMLDFLGEREPFYFSAAKIMTLADRKKLKIGVSALSYATVYYLLSKVEKDNAVIKKLNQFSTLAETIPLNAKTIERGLSADFKDFEDGLQFFSALDWHTDIIISRNKKDFKAATLPVLTPDEYLALHKDK